MNCFNKLLIILFILFVPMFATATCPDADLNNPNADPKVCLTNPLGTSPAGNNPQALIGNIINAVLGLTGSIALVMFIWGGFTWMLSGGSPDKVKKGKDIFIWATIGLVVIFTAYGLVQFVFNAIKG